MVKKIAVLLGGWSSEREISLMSGKKVVVMLRKLGYEVTEIDVKKDLRYLTDELYRANPDYIFNALHGFGGEDGVIQGVLDIFGKPYNCSGTLSSAICFDKAICKQIVKSAGVRTVDGFTVNSTELAAITNRIEYPFVIKPASNGSSIGVFTIFDEPDWHKFCDTPWTFGRKVIVEKYIEGREFTVCVINGQVLGTIEITFKNKTYDYECKYEPGASAHASVFNMDREALQEMCNMSEMAYKACECAGIVRVDFRFDGKQAYFLEINTQPGMTELSLVPDIAKFAGQSFEELLQEIIETSQVQD